MLVESDDTELHPEDEAVRKAEAAVQKHPEVARAFVVVGGGPGASAVSGGIMFLTLVEPDQRQMSQAEVQAALRKDFAAIPGLRAQVQDLSQSGFTAQRGFPVEFSVRGSPRKSGAESSVIARAAGVDDTTERYYDDNRGAGAGAVPPDGAGPRPAEEDVRRSAISARRRAFAARLSPASPSCSRSRPCSSRR